MAIGTPVKLGNTSSTTNVTTTQMTTLAAVAAGESIIVGFVVENATRTLSSVTDSAGNTYAIDQHLLSGTRHLYVASCHNALALASGSLITATTDANTTNRRGLWALSVSGLATASTLDKTNTNSGSSTAWSGGASGTLSQANEIVIGIGTAVSTSSTTADTGYTQTESFLTGGGRGISVWKIVSSTASETPGGTCGNNSWVGITATYKGAGANTVAVGQASETDTAHTVTPKKHAAAGQPAETDTALAITGRKIVHLGIATETDTATSIPTGAGTPVGLASETDSAQPVVPLKRAAVGQAQSTEIALPITARKVIAVGMATETDAALGITGAPNVVVLGVAVETDTATHITAILQGPAVGGGSGEGTGRPNDPGLFRITLTTLHIPEKTTEPPAAARAAYRLASIRQFTETEVDIPANDGRTATVKINMNDPAYALVEEYETLIHVLYVTANTAWPVFWGVITKVDDDSEQETATLYCVDRSLSLARHQIRYGDQVLNEDSDPELPNYRGKGYVALDAEGIKMLRDCGNNTDDQNARAMPDLGIIDGPDTTESLPFATFDKIEVKRGQQVWQTILDVVSHDVAPDIDLNPIDTVFGAYAEINFYERQGNPDPLDLLLHDGCLKNNCRINRAGGGRLTTHQHVLSEGDEKRVTVADAASSKRRGAYVGWDNPGYASSQTDPLVDYGEEVIRREANPRQYFDVKLNDTSGLFYMEDFIVGDACQVVRHRGARPFKAEGHITRVTLRQRDAAGNVTPHIECAQVGGAGDDGPDEDI